MSEDDPAQMTEPAPEELLRDETSLARFQESLDLAEGARLVRQMRGSARRDDGGIGISQEVLAKRINVTQARISQLERAAGRDGPSFVLLKRIARACGVPWPSELSRAELREVDQPAALSAVESPLAHRRIPEVAPER